MRFHRVLADVPCSGDGTMRKAPDIWKRWGVGSGNGLHSLQLRIALQGCRLLEVRVCVGGWEGRVARAVRGQHGQRAGGWAGGRAKAAGHGGAAGRVRA